MDTSAEPGFLHTSNTYPPEVSGASTDKLSISFKSAGSERRTCHSPLSLGQIFPVIGCSPSLNAELSFRIRVQFWKDTFSLNSITSARLSRLSTLQDAATLTPESIYPHCRDIHLGPPHICGVWRLRVAPKLPRLGHLGKSNTSRLGSPLA